MTGGISESLKIVPLSKQLALRNLGRLFELVLLIPAIPYKPSDLVAETRLGGRELKNKWQHSFLAVDSTGILGFVMGYIWAAEGSRNYPTSTLCMSELAVDKHLQGSGLGRKLTEVFLNSARTDPESRSLPISLQTNAAEWNAKVIRFYMGFGFQIVGHEEHNNNVFFVMRRQPV